MDGMWSEVEAPKLLRRPGRLNFEEVRQAAILPQSESAPAAEELMESRFNFHKSHGEHELLRYVIADAGGVGFLFTYDPVFAKSCGKIFKPMRLRSKLGACL